MTLLCSSNILVSPLCLLTPLTHTACWFHTGVLSCSHDQRAQSCDGRPSGSPSLQEWVMLLPCMSSLTLMQLG